MDDPTRSLMLALAAPGDTPDLMALFCRPDWHRDAACLEHLDLDFFARTAEQVAAAKAVCARCLVRDECLDDALASGARDGVWGGRDFDARRARRAA